MAVVMLAGVARGGRLGVKSVAVPRAASRRDAMDLFSTARCHVEAPLRVTCHMGPQHYLVVVRAASIVPWPPAKGATSPRTGRVGSSSVKVGIVVPFSWSFWGGVPEHADHQARTLHAMGHDARIIIGNDPPGMLTKALHPRVGRHEPPPDYVIPVGRSVIVPANGSLSNIVLTPRSIGRIRRTLEREQFDVLHVHEPMTPIVSAMSLVLCDCPVVSTSHSAGETIGRASCRERV